MAHDEPHNVKPYAIHQRGKSDRPDIQAVWGKVIRRCETPPNDQDAWSIASAARPYFAPQWAALDTPLPIGAPVAELQRRNRLKDERKAFLEKWTQEVTPIFFDFFCTEYNYYIRHQ